MPFAKQLLYEDVAQIVTGRIHDGTLSAGAKAPLLRSLGKHLNVSVATVMQAYGELKKNGLLKARPQSGFGLDHDGCYRSLVTSEPTDGYVLWIQLPRGRDANQLYRDTIAQNISTTPGALFSSTGKFRNFLRLCAGQPFNEHIATGIRRLAQLAQNQRTPRNPIQWWVCSDSGLSL